MQSNGFTTKYLTRAAIIAALYVVLTYLAGLMNLAYGPVQFRFSEALTVLSFLFPEAIPGLFVGCVVSNLISPYGMLDLVVGSAATLLAAIWTAKCRKRWFAPMPPVIANAVLVGAMIAWYEAGFGAGFLAAFVYNAATVGLGELVVCYVLGLPLLKVLEDRGVKKAQVYL
ncbi:MAG: QueT transporter family protein [Oscillospiraceae bacterium]|nr:QueT transporter family protein [Oscillospiraceae bacterium]